MTDSPDTTNLPRRRRRPCRDDEGGARAVIADGGDDAELLALGDQIEVFIDEMRKAEEAYDLVDDAVARAVCPLPESSDDRVRQATIDHVWREAAPPGIRHMDRIAGSMELPSLKIMGLPAFTAAGLRVKARLAEFNCSRFYDQSERDTDWDLLCARKLIDSVLEFAERGARRSGEACDAE